MDEKPLEQALLQITSAIRKLQVQLSEEKGEPTQPAHTQIIHKQDLKFQNMQIPQLNSTTPNNAQMMPKNMPFGFNQIVQQMQSPISQPPHSQQHPLPQPLYQQSHYSPQAAQPQPNAMPPPAAFNTSPTLYRQSVISSPQKPTASRLIVKPSSKSDSELLQKISQLEGRLKQYEAAKNQQNQIAKQFAQKFTQIMQHVNFQQNTIESLKKHNESLESQLQNANQMQAIYDRELKQYKAKVLALEKNLNSLRQDLGMGSATINIYDKKRLELTRAMTPNRNQAKSARNSSSRLAVNK